MTTLTKRILTTGAIAAIILFLAWFIINNLLVSRFAPLYPMMSRHSPHFVGPTGTLFFWGILGGILVLLLMVSLLQSKQPRADRGVTDSESPHLMDDVCPGCGADVISNWNVCPYCGYDLP